MLEYFTLQKVDKYHHTISYRQHTTAQIGVLISTYKDSFVHFSYMYVVKTMHGVLI